MRSEVGDELDPIMYINCISYQAKNVVLLTTLMGVIFAYDFTEERLIGSIKVQSAINCLGSLHRSSGFSLGVTLLQIGNLSTPALSDNKCILYAVSIPSLLSVLCPTIQIQQLPIIEQIVVTVLENLSATRELNSLDFDLLISKDERVTNDTYFAILMILCQQWASQMLEL